MKHIVLIGMMGCGKSTCGRLLARGMGRQLVDTDHYIEAREGRTVAKIFQEEGEAYFRQLELAVGRELAQMSPLVIACGGGLPMQQEAMAHLKGSGKVVFLHRDPLDIFEKVTMEGRPLGQEGELAFLERYNQREPVYRRWADLTIESQATPQETVKLILEALK